MTDIHTHILPGIDDGAKNVERAVEMLRYAKKQGVEKVVFTPHYYGKLSVEEFIEKRQESFEKIRAFIPEGMETYLGAEVHFDRANLLQLNKLSALRIGETKYILIELPFMESWSSRLVEKLKGLIEETDCIPIMAHVGRYGEVLKKPSLISEFMEMGCLIQLNTDAFLAKEQKNFAFTLLKKGLVHCIGSDTHDMGKRISVYKRAEAAIKEAGLEKRYTQIQENMEIILRDGFIPREKSKKVRKIFGFYC